MAIKLPHSKLKRSPTSAPNARLANTRKTAYLRRISPVSLGQHCPSHCPPQPGSPVREPGRSGIPLELGPPIDIRKAAKLIGYSPWSVRQRLIPQGLPHFRFAASGKLIFYTYQVIRWIEQQQGGLTTK